MGGATPVRRGCPAEAQGGDPLSYETEAHADLIHAALDEVPDITLPELKAPLAGHEAQVSVTALCRFLPPPQAHAQKLDDFNSRLNSC